MSLQQQPVFYAHTLPGQPEERWERLEVHLEEVAEVGRQRTESEALFIPYLAARQHAEHYP
jgi:hypothetical protein